MYCILMCVRTTCSSGPIDRTSISEIDHKQKEPTWYCVIAYSSYKPLRTVGAPTHRMYMRIMYSRSL